MILLIITKEIIRLKQHINEKSLPGEKSAPMIKV